MIYFICSVYLDLIYLEVNALSLFELLYNDNILDWIVHSTYGHAEAKKTAKR